MNPTRSDTDAAERREPAEDLAMIRRLMEQNRGVIHGTAAHYLLWGVLVTAGLLATWASVQGRLGIEVAWIWPVTIGAGWLASMWIGYRQDRAAPVNTPAGRVMSAIWIGAGVAMTLLGFVGLYSGELGPNAMLASLSAVMGAAYFASGALHGSAWPRLVAAGWWAGSVAIFLWPGVHSLLVMAGLMVFFHLVPGLVVYRSGRTASTAAGRGRAA